MLGISYVSFRAVQILVEIYDGHLTKLCPLDVSYVLLFFPSILSGPLDRYQRVSADLFHQCCGLKHLRYTKHVCVFQILP